MTRRVAVAWECDADCTRCWGDGLREQWISEDETARVVCECVIARSLTADVDGKVVT